jgi:hypothetical protein
MALCEIEAWPLIQGSQTIRLKQPNNRFNWLNTSAENWNKYNEYIQLRLDSNKFPKTPTTLQQIDHIWYHFRDTILKAAAKHIKKFKEKRKGSKPENNTYTPSHIILLSQLTNLSKRCMQTNDITNHRKNIHKLYDNLKTNFQITLPEIPPIIPVKESSITHWHENLLQVLNETKIVFKKLIQNKQTEQIKQFTTRRFEMLSNNKKAMIRSILERPYRNIDLNKLIIYNPDPQIITYPSKIQEITKNHFK